MFKNWKLIQISIILRLYHSIWHKPLPQFSNLLEYSSQKFPFFIKTIQKTKKKQRNILSHFPFINSLNPHPHPKQDTISCWYTKKTKVQQQKVNKIQQKNTRRRKIEWERRNFIKWSKKKSSLKFKHKWKWGWRRVNVTVTVKERYMHTESLLETDFLPAMRWIFIIIFWGEWGNHFKSTKCRFANKKKIHCRCVRS